MKTSRLIDMFTLIAVLLLTIAGFTANSDKVSASSEVTPFVFNPQASNLDLLVDMVSGELSIMTDQPTTTVDVTINRPNEIVKEEIKYLPSNKPIIVHMRDTVQYTRYPDFEAFRRPLEPKPISVNPTVGVLFD